MVKHFGHGLAGPSVQGTFSLSLARRLAYFARGIEANVEDRMAVIPAQDMSKVFKPVTAYMVRKGVQCALLKISALETCDIIDAFTLRTLRSVRACQESILVHIAFVIQE